MSKQTGHLGSAKIRALLQLSACSQGRPQPKHPPACQPSGERDGVGRDVSSASCDGSTVLMQAEEVTARPAAPRGWAFSLLPQPLALHGTTATHPAPAGPAKQPCRLSPKGCSGLNACTPTGPFSLSLLINFN